MDQPKSKDMSQMGQVENFEVKIKEAISLVRSMTTEDKLKAVQYWNLVSENLQDIVNSSADDISALASRLSEREHFFGREQIKLPRAQLAHSVPVAHGGAHYLAAPDVLPQLSVCQNVKILHPPHHLESPGALFSLEDKPGDGNVMSSDLLDQYLTGNPNVAASAHAVQDPASLHAIVDQCDAFSAGVGLEEHVHTSSALESLVSHPTDNDELPDGVGPTPDLDSHRIMVDDHFDSASPHHLGDGDPLPLPNIHLSDAETRELGVEDLDISLPEPCGNSSSANEKMTTEERDGLGNLDDLEKYLTVGKNSKGVTVLNFFTKQTVPTEIDENPRFEYTCNICKEAFATLKSFYVHFAEHTKPIPCAQCDMVFSSRSERKKHMDAEHAAKPTAPPAAAKLLKPGEPRQRQLEKSNMAVTCKECGRQCSNMSNLNRHMRIHSGDRPFQCATCGKSFAEKKSLQTHERLHTGERPYQCSACPSRFFQLSNLNEHMATHSEAKSHLCELCGKGFRQPAQLKTHKLRHEGNKLFRCEKCPMAFNVFNDLKRHRYSHSEQKPLTCDQCGRTFIRQQALSEHMNRHIGVKPYQCPLCTKAYADLSACHKHIKRFHQRLQAEPGLKAKPREMGRPGNAEAVFVVSDVAM